MPRVPYQVKCTKGTLYIYGPLSWSHLDKLNNNKTPVTWCFKNIVNNKRPFISRYKISVIGTKHVMKELDAGVDINKYNQINVILISLKIILYLITLEESITVPSYTSNCSWFVIHDL